MHLGEKGRALAAARNAPPVPVTEQIVQEIKSLYPADPEPPATISDPISALFLSEVAEHVPTTLRKMPRLSEPGPLGMRAEHWYDFGSLAGNSDLFVQVVAHIAAAAVPNSVLQYLRAGQITPLAKPTGGHRPLLMMSFLRRLALKSVMAAKKESVAKCAGPLQYGVGRPDGANTMIKTIQYLAEADNSRVLVALDLKAAFQNVSRRAVLYSIAQTDADLAAVFSKWYTGTTEHRMHYDSAYNKISANSGVDQGCPPSACGFSAVVDPVLRSVMAQLCTHYDTGAKLFAYLDDGYRWIKPQCLLQTIAVITAATRSVNLALESTKTQIWKGSCQDPIPPEFQDKVTLTLSCLGGHLQIHGDTEPSPVNKPLDPKQHHCYGCRYGGGVDRRHAALARCLADIIQSHSGVKVFIEQEVPALTRVVNGQTEHARMDLVFNLNGSVTYLDVSIVAPFSCSPSLVSAASTKPGHMAKRAEKTKFDRYPHINLVPFILETTGRPGPHARIARC